MVQKDLSLDSNTHMNNYSSSPSHRYKLCSVVSAWESFCCCSGSKDYIFYCKLSPIRTGVWRDGLSPYTCSYWLTSTHQSITGTYTSSLFWCASAYHRPYIIWIASLIGPLSLPSTPAGWLAACPSLMSLPECSTVQRVPPCTLSTNVLYGDPSTLTSELHHPPTTRTYLWPELNSSNQPIRHYVQFHFHFHLNPGTTFSYYHRICTQIMSSPPGKTMITSLSTHVDIQCLTWAGAPQSRVPAPQIFYCLSSWFSYRILAQSIVELLHQHEYLHLFEYLYLLKSQALI